MHYNKYSINPLLFSLHRCQFNAGISSRMSASLNQFKNFTTSSRGGDVSLDIIAVVKILEEVKTLMLPELLLDVFSSTLVLCSELLDLDEVPDADVDDIEARHEALVLEVVTGRAAERHA